MTDVCKWTEDEDGNWPTGCGDMHVFLTGNPTQNKYQYCPYCGRTIEVVKEHEEVR